MKKELDRLKEESHQKDILLQETAEEQAKLQVHMRELRSQLDDTNAKCHELEECNKDVLQNQGRVVQNQLKQKDEEIKKLKEDVQTKTAQVSQYKKQLAEIKPPALEPDEEV